MSVVTRVADRVIPGWDQVSAKKLWFEIFLIVTTYTAYSIVRNQFGSAAVDPSVAAEHADEMIDIEKALGIYVEADIQDWFIDATAFIQFWNLFYGAFHFLVTYVVMVFLFLRRQDIYRFWRRTLLVTTFMALAGYALYPLMPPRLLGDCGTYGACRPDSPFVDTLLEIGGIWSFESSGLETLSNQYAAMPSLHLGWALWCALAVVPALKRRFAKFIAGVYPLLTMFAIVVTGNHYIIDGIAGAAVVALAYWVCQQWERLSERSRFTQEQAPSDSGSDDFATSVDTGATESDHRAS